MRVVFLGNHTVGVGALKSISRAADIVGVVAHPEDPEDGVRYLSVYDFSTENNWSVVRGKASDANIYDFIRDVKPDLIWVTDYRYLLPRNVIDLAPLGAVNMHPSFLPLYRGRASINWAILNGETELGLTVHFIDEGMDSGDVIKQVGYSLSAQEDVGDALNKLQAYYESLPEKVIEMFKNDTVSRISQDHSKATEYPARKPKDGAVDWEQPVEQVLNLIRAVAPPYPGAFSYLNDDKGKVLIYKAALWHDDLNGLKAGEVSPHNDKSFVVKCGQGGLHIQTWDLEDSNLTLHDICHYGFVKK